MKQTREAVLSSATYIEPGDRLRNVNVTLTFVVNVDAYKREYEADEGIRDIMTYVKHCVFDYIENGDITGRRAGIRTIMPEGILSDVSMEA